MKKGSEIEFRCVNKNCGEVVSFSITAVGMGTAIPCRGCGRKYVFGGELIEKFRKFAALIEAVRDAEGILGRTHVGLNIQGHSVRVPYRLLLTRMNTFLALDIGGNNYNFRLRVEPLEERSRRAS